MKKPEQDRYSNLKITLSIKCPKTGPIRNSQHHCRLHADSSQEGASQAIVHSSRQQARRKAISPQGARHECQSKRYTTAIPISKRLTSIIMASAARVEEPEQDHCKIPRIVTNTCTPEQIKEAYREQCEIHQPNKDLGKPICGHAFRTIKATTRGWQIPSSSHKLEIRTSLPIGLAYLNTLHIFSGSILRSCRSP